MLVKSLSSDQMRHSLSTSGLQFRAGQFTVNLSSNILSVCHGIRLLYSDCELVSQICDFDVKINKVSGIRSFIKPQVDFTFNGAKPFSPLPYNQAFPLLEWGLNWCVTNHCHQYLVIHAAVLEKNGVALILPGQPGSGKSTLCAGLAMKGGWRLLSDELTMLTLDGQHVVPNPRPISLKNQSINIIKEITSPELFSPVVKDTIKGSVAHLHAPQDSVERYLELAIPKLVVYPKYIAGIDSSLNELSKGQSFIRLADHSFNYSILGQEGFSALKDLHEHVNCYEYTYSGNLDEAIDRMDTLISL